MVSRHMLDAKAAIWSQEVGHKRETATKRLTLSGCLGGPGSEPYGVISRAALKAFFPASKAASTFSAWYFTAFIPRVAASVTASLT